MAKDNIESSQHETEAWPSPTERAMAASQAMALRQQAAKGGLRFEAYLPPALAEWLLDRIEQGTFLDPGEAVFVLLGDSKDLEPHADLRQELWRRQLQSALSDSRSDLSISEVEDELRRMLEAPTPDPAIWKK